MISTHTYTTLVVQHQLGDVRSLANNTGMMLVSLKVTYSCAISAYGAQEINSAHNH